MRIRQCCAAVALAALSVPAAAQTTAPSTGSVTLYGVLDLSMTGTHRDEEGSSLALQSGVQSGSRWGLRGHEDLGGGWRARFQLESGVVTNTGRSAQGSRLFGRAAWLGVDGPLGDLRLGRQTSVSSAVLADFDPFLASYLVTGAQTSLQPFNANRNDNTLAYWTPSAGGWRAGVDYSFDQNAPRAGIATRSKVMSAALVHEGAAHAVTLTVERADWGPGSPHDLGMQAAGGSAKPYAVSLAARGKIDDLTLYGAWSLMRHGSTVPAIQWPGQSVYYPGSTVHGVMLGGAWRVGAGSVLASWQASLPQDGGALARQDATHSQQVLSVGYAHDLSKRTNVYAVLGHMIGAWNDAGWRETQYAVGLRHRY